MLTIAPTLVLATFASVRFCPLEKSLVEADVIVRGRIAAILEPRESSGAVDWTSGGLYELEVQAGFAGAVAADERLRVAGCGNWTCEERTTEYAVGQELFLLLDRDGEHLAPVFGFQSEFLVRDGEIEASHLSPGLGAAAPFFGALPELVAFARLQGAEQHAAWVRLLRHDNADARAFALRRFFRIHFLRDEEPGDPGPYDGIADDVLAELFAGVVAEIPADPGRRSHADRALLNIWAHALDARSATFRASVDATRRRAIERLAVPADVEVDEDDRLKSLYARARLGAVEELPALFAVLGSGDHGTHFKAMAALGSLARTAGLQSRAALDVLAAHEHGSRCEASLGRTARELLGAAGLAPTFAADEELSLAEVARAFRAYWEEHRLELPE
ncbi:MAG: hypothetical protein AAF682_11450 [Planctomycetota bacterium]